MKFLRSGLTFLSMGFSQCFQMFTPVTVLLCDIDVRILKSRYLGNCGIAEF